MKEKTKNKGITLIALVITIIVLLILAGVTIATLTGDNGILNQAGKAKDKTIEAESIERVQVEVAGSYGLDGTIDKEQLNKNLKNINGLTYNGNALSDSNKIADLPAKVSLNGYDIKIKSSGEVEKYDPLAEIIENPNAYYGKEVTNYKSSDSDINTYRIFYVDKENYFGDGKNTIYLKADCRGILYNLNNYASYDTDNTKVREMNPLWANERGYSNEWNINEQVAAYLCSPVDDNTYETTTVPWKNCYNPENSRYVIGGPSIEMYVKSYNQAYKGIIDNTVYTLGTIYRETNAPGYIYTLNGEQSKISKSDYHTGGKTLDSKRYNDMYRGGLYWWLGSPSASAVDSVCRVRGYYSDLIRRQIY